MAYEGDVLHQCLSTRFDFSRAYAVVVSGARANPCGHMIANTGGPNGIYFHVAEVMGFPRYMNANGYQRYLKENMKQELRRDRVFIKNPDAAALKLDQLLSKKWAWGVLPHNCAAFVEAVFQAGGANGGLFLNCPTLEQFS